MNIRTLISGTLMLSIVFFGCSKSDSDKEQPTQQSQQERRQLRIVGSSTVYPFASAVAEKFGATTQYPTPAIESTGTGGGMKLFSKGNGIDTPDITNASRKIRMGEYSRCQKNGVEQIVEAMIGYDGIVLAQNNTNDSINFTRRQLTLAVAAKVPDPDGGNGLVDNPFQYWNEIDSSLPDREIIIYGPPPTSGTRDAFEELVIEHTVEQIDAYNDHSVSIRQDGPWVNSGENDNKIVKN